MKKTLLSIVTILSTSVFAQNMTVISCFDWNSNPITSATIGPDATSVSSSAYSDSLGTNNTNGLNAGNNPKKNVHLVLPGSYFNVDGIEVSIDFRRDENTGYFFTRGNSLKFGMTSGKLRVQFRLSDGNGGYVQHVHTNLFNIPKDGNFRNYAFKYDQNTGEAKVIVDTVVVWSNIESGEPMYWNGAGNMIIGQAMDGTGYNNTIFDNAKISEIHSDVLSVEYLNFSIKEKNELPILDWSTANERNNSHFLIEKSDEGKGFIEVGKVLGNGNTNEINEYSFEDANYEKGESAYYRINQIDLEGKSNVSKIVKFEININKDLLANVYPTVLSNENEVINVEYNSTNDDVLRVSTYNMSGELLSSKSQPITEGKNLFQFDSQINNKGNYILVVEKSNKVYTSKIVY